MSTETEENGKEALKAEIKELKEKLIDVPREVDLEVANRKLAFLGVAIDKLTPQQEEYLRKSNV